MRSVGRKYRTKQTRGGSFRSITRRGSLFGQFLVFIPTLLISAHILLVSALTKQKLKKIKNPRSICSEDLINLKKNVYRSLQQSYTYLDVVFQFYLYILGLRNDPNHL